MESANASAQALREQILATEAQLQKLKDELAQVEAHDATQRLHDLGLNGSPVTELNDKKKWPLLEEEYKRYGRQMIVTSIGIQGLYFLCFARVKADFRRSTASQIFISPDHRSRWPGMSSCCVHCWRRRWEDRTGRWRYSRGVEFASPNTSQCEHCGDAES